MSKYGLVIVFLLLIGNVRSQCLPKTVFYTKDIGTYDEHMNLSMNFHFVGDSVYGYAGSFYQDNLKPFFLIKLVGKPSCNWNTNFTEGETSYSALVDNSPKPSIAATFKIIYKKSGEKYLVILYPDNKEPRVLTIIDNSRN